ncbi:MAG: hypothetical protein HQL13_02320 [Candidatus Omnitrophica bacterium]|nr:hypothetical protein [Candidatus Omnitrophota bacterium]
MKSPFEESDGWVKVPVSLKLYPLQSIHSAGYVFMDKAHVRLEEDKKDFVAVWLKSKDEGENLQKLALSFSDELLNYAHYFSSLKANGENMKILLQRALFSASPSLVKEAEEKEIEDLIKELEQEEKEALPKSKKGSRVKK